MNFINCENTISNRLVEKTVAFWSENSMQHITSLLRSTNGTTAVLQPYFREELKNFSEEFKNFKEVYSKNTPRQTVRPISFLRTNARFINLLERIKYEGFSGYPILQQSVFHYIYEQRYVNAVLGVNNPLNNLLITEYFSPFQNYNCIYNQMYFWCIIGSMHPSLLMGNNGFYNAINGYSKEFLTDICNNFNLINFKLSSLKKPIKKGALQPLIAEFKALNLSFLEFLKLVKSGNPRIFTNVGNLMLSNTLYATVEHMINEHSLVEEISRNFN